MNNLVDKLPVDGQQKEPSSDVVVNICGALNNMVTCSAVAARDITFFDGLQKLVAIKNSNDSRYGIRINIDSSVSCWWVVPLIPCLFLRSVMFDFTSC